MSVEFTKVGYYKTRDGGTAWVAGYNHKALTYKLVGWIGPVILQWTTTGLFLDYREFPHDLVEYLGLEKPQKVRPFEVGDVTKTRDGRDARIICVDHKNSRGHPVIALILGTHEEIAGSFDSLGQYAGEHKNRNSLQPMYEDDAT